MNLTYPLKTHIITQPFGANSEYYKKFGLSGTNLAFIVAIVSAKLSGRLTLKGLVTDRAHNIDPSIVSGPTPPTNFSRSDECLWMVLKNVFTRAFTQLQVSYSIISSYMIFMVNNFKFTQISFQVFFHHEPMFRNISLFATHRMTPGFNVPITTSFYPTALPTRRFISPRFREFQESFLHCFGYLAVSVGYIHKYNLNILKV